MIINKMLRRKRNSLSEEELHENEIGLRKRQQVKYYESSSSEDDSELIQSRLDKKSGNKSKSSDADDSDFGSEDSDPDFKKSSYQKKNRSSKKKGNESMSEYEKHLLQKKTENLEFLKTIGVDEAKNELLDLKPKKRVYKKKDYSESSNGPKRVSQREKAYINYTEGGVYKYDIKSGQEPTEQTFKEVLNIKSSYENFVEDLNEIMERDDFIRTPVLYDKDVLKQLSENTDLPQSRIYRPSAMSWYPSSEHLILAIGESTGNLTLWNIKESDYLHKFFIHSKKVSNLQFNPFNTFHLISSSWDGTLLCCDMQKQIFSEVLKISKSCTHFDFFSPSSYLVSLTNGQVVIVDRRNRGKGEYQHKMYTCHDSTINSIHVHPVEENYFVTAGADKKICIWDLRKLSKSPIIENTNYSKSVASAFFSPLSGKYLLTTSHDKRICIFDNTKMTEGRMKLHKCIKSAFDKASRSTIWLPNSDDTFAWFNKESSKMLQIYDKDFNVSETVTDGIKGQRELNTFHPFKPAIASVISGSIKISAGENI